MVNSVRQEAGFTLVGVLIAVAVINVLAGTLLVRWSTVMQQEREREAIWRGQQYAAALDCHLRKQGRYPVRLEQLIEQHCIRRLYEDPLGDSGGWKLIRASDVGLSEEADAEGDGGSRTAGAGFTNPGERAAGSPDTPEAAERNANDSGGSFRGGGGGMSRTTFRERLRQQREEWQTPEVQSQQEAVAPAATTTDPNAIVGIASNSVGPSLLLFDGKRRHEQWRFMAAPRGPLIGSWTFVPKPSEEDESEDPGLRRPGQRGRNRLGQDEAADEPERKLPGGFSRRSPERGVGAPS